MWVRSGFAMMLVLGLAACSAQPPGAAAVTGTAAVIAVPEPKPATKTKISQLRCKTVLGEVEGFGKESVRATAEQSRVRAIADEKAHRSEIGQTIASVDLIETECVAVYPIGAEEWHCMARAKVCALLGGAS